MVLTRDPPIQRFLHTSHGGTSCLRNDFELTLVRDFTRSLIPSRIFTNCAPMTLGSQERARRMLAVRSCLS
jgi:hypothetical protein